MASLDLADQVDEAQDRGRYQILGRGRTPHHRPFTPTFPAQPGRPSPVPMQAMSPAHSLLRASTSNALSTRLARGSPIPTAFARLRFLLAPFACSPSLRMTASARFLPTAMPSRPSSRLIRRYPQRPLRSRASRRRSPPGPPARSARWISSSSRSHSIRIRARARSRMPSRWGRTRPYALWGTRASRMVLTQECPEIF